MVGRPVEDRAAHPSTAACGDGKRDHDGGNNANNGEYLDRLINEHGVELREFGDEIYDAFGEAAEEVFEETRAHSDLANRIYESFQGRADRRRRLAEAFRRRLHRAQRNRVLGV